VIERGPFGRTHYDSTRYMRIALIIYGTLDTLSGGYLYDRKLVEHWRATGDTVEIVSLPWRSYRRHLGDNLDSAWRARLRALRADVIVQDELNHPSLVWVNRVLRAQRAPVVSIVHHLRVSERHPRVWMPLYRAVERTYLRSCDAFVFNSRTTRDSVWALAGVQRPHVVAYPAADHGPVVPPTPDTGEALRLISVGNLIARKGLHTLLRALRMVAGNWQLQIVGRDDVDPVYAAQVRALAAPLGDRVIFRGRLDDAALAAAYAAADVFVGPSQYEGFGIVYLEALRAGLPVIATTAGAAGEIVTDGVEGLLVPPEDPAALAAALNRMSDRPMLQRMRAAAGERAARHPTWRETGENVRAFLAALRM
jgi:glycosyltransferase involved in cell wall biosynthesis